MRELLNDAVQRAVRMGAAFADARGGEVHSTSICAQDGRIHDLSVSQSRGFAVRVLVDGAWGFATAASDSAEELRRCVDDAVSMARAAAGSVAEPAKVASAQPVEAVSKLPFKIDPTTVPLSERAQVVASFEERLRKHHDAIVNTVVYYDDSSGTVELVSSNGTYVRWENLWSRISCLATASDGQTRQLAYDGKSLPAGWEVVSELDVDEFAGGVAQRAVDLLKAAEPPAGTMTVVLDPDITGLLTHEAFGHNCEADLVWAGESIVAGKEGQQVAATCITIVDDPTLPGHNGTIEYDDEGVPARKHVLVKDGILLGEYLHSLETAAHFGVEPNGAGRAGGYTKVPVPRMSNTFIEPGDADLDALIAEVDRGLMLCRSRGGYVDTARGHFTFMVETGYEINGGKLGQQIRNCTLSGYTLETLQQVLGVSRHFELQDSGTCGKKGQGVRVSLGGPHLLVKELTVGGSRVE